MFDILYYSNHIDKDKSIELLMNAIPNLYTLPPISLISFDGGWERLRLSEETEKNSIRSSIVYVGSMQGQ